VPRHSGVPIGGGPSTPDGRKGSGSVRQGDFGHADIFLDRYLKNLVIIYKDVLTQIPI
jgi:hypothetical protein